MNLASLFNSIPDTIAKFEHISFKAKIAAFFTAFLTPLYDMMLVLVLFLVLDMVTSLYAQIKRKKERCIAKQIETQECKRYFFKSIWRTIDPNKLPRTIEKIFSYAVAMIVCFILDYYILRTEMGADGRLYAISISNMVYIVILVTEAISILRNLGSITDNAVFNQIIKILVKKTNTEDYTPPKPTKT